jgi:RHS repeat-associated protein
VDGRPYSVRVQEEDSFEEYFYVLNLQGDVIGIVDGGGNQIVGYTYDAWGNILSTTGSMASTLGQLNPLRYRGYVYDQETNLYYLQSRYYNPEWGRFINADSLLINGKIIGLNLFAYSLNNPVNLVDPGGAIPISDGFFEDSYRLIGEWIGKMLRDSLDEDRRTAQKLTYISNGEKNGAQIIDSYLVNNPIVMYEYIEMNRGDEISGTTIGVVVEWGIHNVAHTVYGWIGDTAKVEQAADVNIGKTIYSDNHGAFSVLMIGFYWVVAHIPAAIDAAIDLFGG